MSWLSAVGHAMAGALYLWVLWHCWTLFRDELRPYGEQKR